MDPESPRETDRRASAPPTLLNDLKRRMQQLQAGSSPRRGGVFSSGAPPLDALLVEGGLPRACLVEWLGGAASGAAALALLAAGQAMRDGGFLVVVDRRRRFYPPAAEAWGLCLQRTIVLHPADVAQWQWSVAQALRCPGVSAVWTEAPEQPPRLLQPLLRRWQLAAEQGGGAGLLVRPAAAQRQPHWAEVRLQVRPVGPPPSATGAVASAVAFRKFQIAVLRGAALGATRAAALELEIDLPHLPVSRHDFSSRALPLAAQLAHPKAPRRSARA